MNINRMLKEIRKISHLIMYVFFVSLLTACGGSSSSDDDSGGGATSTNTAPTANAGAEQAVSTGTLVTLDATASSDSEGDSLTYTWSISSIPDGSAASLSDNSSATPSFTADLDGSYVISLVVNDGTVDSSADTVTITATTPNNAPVANAGDDQSISTGDIVSLSGESSSDSDLDSLTYAWSFTSIPDSSTATLDDETSATPSFTADLDGDYILALMVNDGSDESESDTVIITASTTDCEEITPTYSYTIVDTNQTLCYDESDGDSETCVGEGQDGDYEGNQPNYSFCNSGEVVVDNNTALMWQASSDTDGTEGLTKDDQLSQADAESYCEGLTYGNYSDWRLPSTKELVSIYLMSGEDLSAKTGATTNGEYVDTAGVEPFLDANYFDIGYGDTSAGERIIDGQYATSTLNITQVRSGITYNQMDGFFGVNFADGHIKTYETDPTYGDFYTRCVRGNTDYGVNNFTDNGNETISDSATGLMWQKNDSGDPASTFSVALASCEAATTGDKTDWRLPNMKELHSIVDYTRSPDNNSSPAIDTDYFSSTQVTNEAGQTDWPFYWTSTALLNYLGSGNKGAYITFGRGLGYFTTNDIGVVDVHGAGAQRSDGKTTDILGNPNTSTFTPDAFSDFGTTGYTSGPQGDILRPAYNYVRCVTDEDSTTEQFTLSSIAITDDELKDEYKCEDKVNNVENSIPLEWANVPDGTGSLAIIMHHYPDSSDTSNVNSYLLLWGIDPSVTEIPYGEADDGTWYIGSNKDGTAISYTSPCSPSAGSHEYTITVYALSETPSSLPTESTLAVDYDTLVDAIQTVTILDTATLTFNDVN